MAHKKTTTRRAPAVRVDYPEGSPVRVDYPGQYGTEDGWVGDRKRGVAELDVASPKPRRKAAPVAVRAVPASKVRKSLVAAKKKRPVNRALMKKR